MAYGDKSFIEVQFPVSEISKESFKERKAGRGQTLTGLGKWWGRKPLILVRAVLLGLLMPASDNPKKDRDIFLKILGMDSEGLWLRKNRPIPVRELYYRLTPDERERYFTGKSNKGICYKKGSTREERDKLERLVFDRLSYDEKLKYCIRPEELENIPQREWRKVNHHLGTNASNLQQLVRELGKRRFVRVPVIGDCFCGGGSIPFEAARIGLNVYASDLSPIAVLLTWAALNINGGSRDRTERLRGFQEKIFNLADKQITKWGIEHNEKGDRANCYLYCNEVTCPKCGYRVPLAPSWVIGKATGTVAILKENGKKGFDIKVKSNASREEVELAKKMSTVRHNRLYCPHCNNFTPIAVIRGDKIGKKDGIKYGLRRWEAHEFAPRPEDVFQERLYCIRCEREFTDEKGRVKVKRYYTEPTKEDLKREDKVIELLKERFGEWQQKGYIPSSAIEEGVNTTQVIRERGWTYWHQLFNPRQLLVHGLLMELIDRYASTDEERIIGLLGINRCINLNSKLSTWHQLRETIEQTFINQALNALFNYPVRGFKYLNNAWFLDFRPQNFLKDIEAVVVPADARRLYTNPTIWFTDPPYADTINYHELSEFFLAWDRKILQDIFPDWYCDSNRSLAVRGTGGSFKQSMVEIYNKLASGMPPDGIQIVMFNHQDISVWADLALILQAAELKVTAAWSIVTEADSKGIRQGKYVKSTVMLVLRRQISGEKPRIHKLYVQIEDEVKRQLDNMEEPDEKGKTSFSTQDYLLAAYAACLKVLTSYKSIDNTDIHNEIIKKAGDREGVSFVEQMLNEAERIAYKYIVSQDK